MAKQANNILLIYRLFLEMISSRTFITKNIECKKYYQREGQVLNSFETDQKSVVTIPTLPPSTQDPFDAFDDFMDDDK